jgi:hypothetical protein
MKKRSSITRLLSAVLGLGLLAALPAPAGASPTDNGLTGSILNITVDTVAIRDTYSAAWFLQPSGSSTQTCPGTGGFEDFRIHRQHPLHGDIMEMLTAGRLSGRKVDIQYQLTSGACYIKSVFLH